MIANSNITVGSELPLLTVVAYQRALDEVPFREDSSHKDDYARSKEYAGALLSGYILCGYISRFLVDFFGPDWLTGGQVSISFIKAVHQRDAVTVRGTVVDKAEASGGMRLTVEFRMEKSDGTTVVVGEASGAVSQRKNARTDSQFSSNGPPELLKE